MKPNVEISAMIDLAGGRLSAEESLRLLEQIERDREASKWFEFIVRITSFVADHGREAFDTLESGLERGALPKAVTGTTTRIRMRPWPILAGAMALLLAAVMIAGRVTSSKYSDLVRITTVDFETHVRGSAADDIDVARQEMSSGQYDDAIVVLERTLRAFPAGLQRDYAHFLAGVAYLASSRSDFFSLFVSYDTTRVLDGIRHLDDAVRLTSNRRILSHSHLYKAKGLLMLGHAQKAIEELTKAGSEDGTIAKEVRVLQSEIRRRM